MSSIPAGTNRPKQYAAAGVQTQWRGTERLGRGGGEGESGLGYRGGKLERTPGRFCGDKKTEADGEMDKIESESSKVGEGVVLLSK